MRLDEFVKVCNENNGFIIGVLTFVYVVATILICIFNYHSVKQAKCQIQIGNLIQKQNIDMQLFDIRKRVVLQLDKELKKKAYYIKTKVYEWESGEKYEERLFDILSELELLFKSEDFDFAYQANSCMNEVLQSLALFSRKKSEFVFAFFKDDYKEKLLKFDNSTKDYLEGVIDEKNYVSICEACDTDEMCQCMVQAYNKLMIVDDLLENNDVVHIFEENYLTFK